MKKHRYRINKKHKDRLFLKIFKDKSSLLELYNALNSTNYTNTEDLEITTIEDALYMGMKNDVSFLFGEELHLFEHQSTCNPNMPLRGLLYLSDVYQGYLSKNKRNLFSSKLIPLPEPTYIIFYNGTSKEPDRKELRLSDSFIRKSTAEPHLELKATVININLGHNRELMEQCRKLHDYSLFIHYVRVYLETEHDLETAVDMAVDCCIKEEIMTEFLRKHRGEVCGMMWWEYDEQAFLESEREVWKEEGRDEGRLEGQQSGRLEGRLEGAIAVYRELGLSKEETLEKMLKQFTLNKEEASKQLNAHW